MTINMLYFKKTHINVTYSFVLSAKSLLQMHCLAVPCFKIVPAYCWLCRCCWEERSQAADRRCLQFAITQPVLIRHEKTRYAALSIGYAICVRQEWIMFEMLWIWICRDMQGHIWAKMSQNVTPLTPKKIPKMAAYEPKMAKNALRQISEPPT